MSAAGGRGSAVSLKSDIVGGITTFLTMSYIVFVNPDILSKAGIPFNGALTATVLICFLMTLLMGVYAKLPFAIAPGMGINAYFAFHLVLGKGIPWTIALGMVFWSGVIFIAISATRLREWIAQAVPVNLRGAAAVGIGVFLTLIGFKSAGFVVGDPVTLVKLGPFTHQVALFLLGLLTMIFFLHRRSPWAFLIGIGLVTGISLAGGWVQSPETFLAPPDFSSAFFKLDIWGAFQLTLLPAILTLLFTDLFDSLSTFMGVSKATGLVEKDGSPKNLREGLLVDAFATFSAGLLGSSSGTAYIESSAGIEAGGRTGRSAIVTALCFLPLLFIAPIAGMIPSYATAPVLVLVGAMMFRTVTDMNWGKFEEMVPAFLTIILIPLTFSITQGILWGFVSHVLLYLAAGRAREIGLPMVCIFGVSVLFLVLEYTNV